MFKVQVTNHFSSAHNLREYQGNCERLHGHNWQVEVTLKSKELDELGMVIDFKEIKKDLKVIIDELDHVYINELDYFKVVNPTSENLAKYIFDRLALIHGDKMDSVAVYETPSSKAIYIKE